MGSGGVFGDECQVSVSECFGEVEVHLLSIRLQGLVDEGCGAGRREDEFEGISILKRVAKVMVLVIGAEPKPKGVAPQLCREEGEVVEASELRSRLRLAFLVQCQFSH